MMDMETMTGTAQELSGGHKHGKHRPKNRAQESPPLSAEILELPSEQVEASVDVSPAQASGAAEVADVDLDLDMDLFQDFLPNDSPRKKKKLKRVLVLGALLLVVLAGAYLAYVTWLSPAEETVDAEYKEYTVSQGDIRVSYDADGSVTLPYDYLDAQYSAEITEIRAAKGDSCKEGDVLAVLDNTAWQDALDAKQDALDAAQDSVVNAEFSLRDAQNAVTSAHQSVADAETSLTTAQHNLRRQQGSYQSALNDADVSKIKKQQEIEKSKRSIEQYKLQIQNAENELAYMQSASDDYSTTEINDKKNSVANLKRQLSSEESNLVVLQKQASIEDTTALSAEISLTDAQNAVEKARRDIDKAQNAITDAEQNVEKAQNNLDTARRNVEKAQKAYDEALADMDNIYIKAPADGTIAAVNLEVGDTAAPVPSPSTSASFIIFMPAGAAYKATASIPELDIASVFEGQAAEITIDAWGDDVLTGTVTSLSRFASDGGNGVVSYQAVVEFYSDDPDIRDQMNAGITYITKEVKDVINIPADALYSENGKSYVDVKTADGGREKRAVTTGFSEGTTVEIQSGLSVGETVFSQTAKNSSSSSSSEESGGEFPMGMAGGGGMITRAGGGDAVQFFIGG